VKAVVVAIAHVAQRDAVEGETQLVLVEGADGDARGPLVGAEGVGGLEVHARQLLDHLDRAGSRRRPFDLLEGQRLDLAALALAVDDQFFDGGCVLGGMGCGGGEKEGEGGGPRDER